MHGGVSPATAFFMLLSPTRQGHMEHSRSAELWLQVGLEVSCLVTEPLGLELVPFVILPLIFSSVLHLPLKVNAL